MKPERPMLSVWPCLYPSDDTQARSMDEARRERADRARREHREAMRRYLRGEGDCPEFRRWS